MNKNIQIQIQEINRLMNYDRSKTLNEQDTMFTRNLDRIYSKPESAEKFNQEIHKYRHEILDGIAIMTFFVPIVGPLLSLGIEVGNAALYAAEGNKEMAALSAAFALIPGGEYIRQIPAIKNVSKRTIIKIFQRANKGKVLSKANQEILEAVAENSGKISRLAKLGALGKMLSAFGKLSLRQRLIVLYKLIKQFPGMGGQGFGLINQGLIQIGGILYTIPKLFEVFGIDGSDPNDELISQIESGWGNVNDKELNDALEGAFGMLPEEEKDSAVAEFFGWVDEAEKTGESNTNKTQTSNKKETTTDSNSIPQNIVDGVMKKGFLIGRGIHNQESKYPGMMKAIEFIQQLVGAKVDGQFGPETESKVKNYQKSKGLKDDGIVGEKTMSKIIEDIK